MSERHGHVASEPQGDDEPAPDESPFESPEVMTGYPLSEDEQERTDRLVEKTTKKEK